MNLEYDENKRQKVIEERGLDFKDAGSVFDEINYTVQDDRKDYGEDRFITVGKLGETFVVLVWTDRPPNRRIISMRKANANEQGAYYDAMD